MGFTSPAFIVAVTVLVGSALALNAVVGYLGLYLQKLEIQAEGGRRVSAVPRETPSWIQIDQDEQLSSAMVEELGTQNFVSRVFVSKEPIDGKRVVLQLHMAYYTGLLDAVPHIPDRCLVGGGLVMTETPQNVPLPLSDRNWSPDERVPESLQGRVWTARLSPDPRYTDRPGQRIRLPFSAEPGEKPEFELRVAKFQDPSVQGSRDAGRLVAGYFFIANGEVVANAEDVRRVAFKLHDDYAYFLKVQVSSGQADSREELARWSAMLLDELMPEIMRCVPDWVRVTEGTYPADNPRRLKTAGAPGA